MTLSNLSSFDLLSDPSVYITGASDTVSSPKAWPYCKGFGRYSLNVSSRAAPSQSLESITSQPFNYVNKVPESLGKSDIMRRYQNFPAHDVGLDKQYDQWQRSSESKNRG